MPTTVLSADLAGRAPATIDDAMRGLEEALWAAADALPDLPDAEEPDGPFAFREALPG